MEKSNNNVILQSQLNKDLEKEISELDDFSFSDSLFENTQKLSDLAEK